MIIKLDFLLKNNYKYKHNQIKINLKSRNYKKELQMLKYSIILRNLFR